MKRIEIRSGEYDDSPPEPCILMGNTIVLPRVIEYDTMVSFLECLNQYRESSDRTVYLYVRGDGGSMEAAFGICNLIELDGNVAGVLTGQACSAHSIIWASCPKRYTMKDGSLGIHKCWISAPRMNGDELLVLSADMIDTDKRVMEIYLNASNRDRAWWETRITSSIAFLNIVAAPVLKDIGMACEFTKEMMETI